MSFVGEFGSGADSKATEEVRQEVPQRGGLILPTLRQMDSCPKEKEQMATETTAPLSEQSKNNEF